MVVRRAQGIVQPNSRATSVSVVLLHWAARQFEAHGLTA